jgi:hypothetical protein
LSFDFVDIDNHSQFLFIYLQEEMGGMMEADTKKKLGMPAPTFEPTK